MKVQNIKCFNMIGALRGMRNPMMSHHLSDSYINEFDTIIIGSNDYKLAKKLINAGSDHCKFLRQIFVSCDVTAPDFFFKEYVTYKVGTVENSSSTMHKITSKPLTLDDFELSANYTVTDDVVSFINKQIEIFNMSDKLNDNVAKEAAWRAIIENLPMSFLYTRHCTLNYQVLKNMYFSRKNHKLKEWRYFLNAMETSLPYSEFFTGEFK